MPRHRAGGRRSGKLFVTASTDAVAKVRWAKEGLPALAASVAAVDNQRGPAGLWEPHYDPLWRVCEELDIPIRSTAAAELPAYGEHEAAGR